MKSAIAILLIILAWLQYRLWVSEGGVAEVYYLQEQLADQMAQNEALRQKNFALEDEIQGLKTDPYEIEGKARESLGLIKPNETFFHLPAQQAPVEPKVEPLAEQAPDLILDLSGDDVGESEPGSTETEGQP